MLLVLRAVTLSFICRFIRLILHRHYSILHTLLCNYRNVTSSSAGYGEDDLRLVLSKRDETIGALKEELRAQKKRASRVTNRCQELRQQLVTARADYSTLVEQTRFRAGPRKHCSRRGAYELALARNRAATTSSRAIVSLMAGSESQGSLQDPKLVIRYEGLAAAYQIISSKQKFAAINADLSSEGPTEHAPAEQPAQPAEQPAEQPPVQPAEQPSSAEGPAEPAASEGPAEQPAERTLPLAWEVICVEADATQQEALDREKIHIAVVDVTALGYESHLQTVADCAASPDASIIVDSLQQRAVRVRSHADLQAVQDGTGAETYLLMKKELESVGCPTWESRIADATANPRRLSVFCFGLDRGPDNIGAIGRIKTALRPHVNVMFFVGWCLMHLAQCTILNILKVFDTWEWAGCGHKALPQAYFSCVATVANIWRDPGIHKKLLRASNGIEAAVSGVVSKIPGRCLRGRWGSIDDVEHIINAGGTRLVRAWRAVFKWIVESLERGDASTSLVAVANDGGTDDAKRFQAEQSQWRTNAVVSLSTVVFHIVMTVSIVVKRPVVHFLRWLQKADREYNNASKAAVAGGSGKFMGPTPLSRFVCEKVSPTCVVVYASIAGVVALTQCAVTRVDAPTRPNIRIPYRTSEGRRDLAGDLCAIRRRCDAGCYAVGHGSHSRRTRWTQRRTSRARDVANSVSVAGSRVQLVNADGGTSLIISPPLV